MAVPSSDEAKVAINVFIPRSLDDRLEQFCFDQKMTKRAFVIAALQEKLDREEGLLQAQMSPNREQA